MSTPTMTLTLARPVPVSSRLAALAHEDRCRQSAISARKRRRRAALTIEADRRAVLLDGAR